MTRFKIIQDLSIKNKIIIIILSIIFLIQSIGFTFIAIWDIKRIKSEIQTNLVLNTKLVANNCVVPLTFGDDQQATEALLHLKNIKTIEMACLFDKDGTIFATYPETLNKKDIPIFTEQQNSILEDAYFHIYEPVLFQNEKYGTLYIKANSKPLRIAKRRIIITLILLSIVLDILAIFLAIRMQHYISKPIINLKNHFDKIARNHDFSQRIEKRNNDEVGHLYDGFNNLINQISIKQEERKIAENELHLSEEKYRILIKSTPLPLCLVDNDGNIVYTNDRFTKIFGYFNEDIPTLNDWWIKAYPDKKYREWVLNTWNDAVEEARIEGGDIESIEYTVTCKNGSELIIIIAGITTDEGVLATFIDVTERKFAEIEIRKLSKVFLEATVPTIIENLDGIVQEMNEQAIKEYGYSRAELLGRSIKLLVPEEKHIQADELLKLCRNGKAVRNIEGLRRKKDGTEIPVLVSLSMLTDESGSPIGISSTASNITELKKAETEIKKINENLEERVKSRTAELESVNKELEAFSYSVSHDLKAPLRAVVGFSQILKEDYGTEMDMESNRYIGLIKDNAENMGALINDLLNFSRMGRKELQKSQIDLSAIVQRVKSELQADVQDREISIKIMNLPSINADENLIYHVMLNLMSNAIKFTSKLKNAIVEVGYINQDNENIFYVKDNGIGFNMKYAEKIFDVFQRLHSIEEFPGTGIGLSIVQRIIHKHEGKIWVESEMNIGTTFFFTI